MLWFVMNKKYFIVLVLCLLAGLLGVLSMVTKKKPLQEYHTKRAFTKTPEPYGKKKKQKGNLFVIQKHAASHLHYDFRLEIDGVLVSWAIPKGPSTNPAEKRLAVMTEDHPMDYADFEGIIPEGNYGAGTVMVWDIGTYTNIKEEYGITMEKALKEGKIEVELHGKKMKGSYALIRTRLHDDKKNWLFFKINDDQKVPSIKNKEKSALTERTMMQITKEATRETKYGKK
jgi:bifunctional non-homologous end joining protein LigD